MKKQKMLFFKLKGELGFREVRELEKLVNKTKKGHIGIIFDLTNLSFIDSSGIGFLVSEYSLASDEKISIKFLYKSKEIDVADQTSLFRLCQDIISKKSLEVEEKLILSQAVNEKISEILSAKNAQFSVLKSGDTAAVSNRAEKKEASPGGPASEYSSNKINVEEIPGYKAAKNKEITVFEKYKIFTDPNKKGIYIPGLIISLILLASSFLPDTVVKHQPFDFLSNAVKLGINSKAVSLFISIFAGILSLVPAINIKQRSPFLLMCSILGVISLYGKINIDSLMPDLFPHTFLFKRQFELLMPCLAIMSVFLKQHLKNKNSKLYKYIILAMILYIFAVYLIPFTEYKGLILSGIKKKSLLIESSKRVVNLSSEVSFVVFMQNMYFLLPFAIALACILILFLKASAKLVLLFSKFLLFFFPLLFLGGAIYSGFIYKETVFYHNVFYCLTLASYFFYGAVAVKYLVFERSKQIQIVRSVLK